jgi:pyridoxamine 5'-phosphate oxidase
VNAPAPTGLPRSDAPLDVLFAAAWALLGQGAAHAAEDCHWPVLASVAGPSGADARVVVLRRADRTLGELEVHSDARAHKLAQLRAAPGACLVFHDRRRGLQLRAWGDAAIHVGDAAARRAWDALAPSTHRTYLAPRPPGEPTEAPDPNLPEGLHGALPDAAQAEPGFAHFAAIVLRVQRIEWLELDRNGHRRARFETDPRTSTTAMHWIRP